MMYTCMIVFVISTYHNKVLDNNTTCILHTHVYNVYISYSNTHLGGSTYYYCILYTCPYNQLYMRDYINYTINK